MARKELKGVNALYFSLSKGMPWNELPRARYSADMDTSDEDVKGAQFPAYPPQHTKRRNRASSQESISHSSNQVSNSPWGHQACGQVPLVASEVQGGSEEKRSSTGQLGCTFPVTAKVGASLCPCCHHNNKPVFIATHFPACPY